MSTVREELMPMVSREVVVVEDVTRVDKRFMLMDKEKTVTK